MKNKTPWVAAAMVLCLPLLVQAQSDPADGKSPAPVGRYESAFTDYKPWKDISPGDWRAANQAVSAGSTAAGPGAPAAPSMAGTTTPAAAPKPPPAASAGHEGHHPQGGQK